MPGSILALYIAISTVGLLVCLYRCGSLINGRLMVVTKRKRRVGWTQLLSPSFGRY